MEDKRNGINKCSRNETIKRSRKKIKIKEKLEQLKNKIVSITGRGGL
jgi:hypothetical protein